MIVNVSLLFNDLFFISLELEKLEITATIINGKGAYTGEQKEILMVVVRKQVAPRVEQIVKEEEREAFMIVSSASEIFGQGYKDIMRDRI